MSGKNLKTILGEYSMKRLAAERRADDEIESVYIKCPRLKEIKQESFQLGINATKAVMKNPSKKDEIMAALQEDFNKLDREKRRICIENNIPLDFGTVRYECEVCKDQGILQEGGQCNCLKQKIIETCYDKTNMQKLVETQNFDTFDINIYSDEINSGGTGITQRELMKNHIRVSKDFISDVGTRRGNNLLFQGETGTGKTFLSSCIAREVIRTGKTVLYKTAGDIIKLASKIQFGGAYNDEIAKEYDMLMDCDLLIIDDLGTEVPNKFVVSELYHIINARIVSGKKFIISTNLSTVDINKIYTSRIAYRLVENCAILRFEGDNLRRRRRYTK